MSQNLEHAQDDNQSEPSDEELNEASEKLDEALEQQTEAPQEKKLKSAVEIADESDDDAELHIPTGISALDQLLHGGLSLKTITILGGEPGVGKTTLLLHMARCAAAENADTDTDESLVAQGVPTLFFSLEMPARRLSNSLMSACIYQGYADKRIKEPVPSYDLSKKWETIDSDVKSCTDVAQKICIMDKGACDSLCPEDLFKNVEEWLAVLGKAPDSPVLIIIDYLQKMEPKNRPASTEERFRIKQILTELEAARDAHPNAAIVLISALNRESYKNSGEITLASFKDAGEIEYAMDLALALERGKKKSGRKNEHVTSQVSLRIIKSRFSAPDKDMSIDFYGDYAYFDAGQKAGGVPALPSEVSTAPVASIKEEDANGNSFVQATVINGFRFDVSNKGAKLLRKRNPKSKKPLKYEEQGILYTIEGPLGSFDMAVAEAIFTLCARPGKKEFSTHEIFKTLRGQKNPATFSQRVEISNCVERLMNAQFIQAQADYPELPLSEGKFLELDVIRSNDKTKCYKYAPKPGMQVLPMLEVDQSHGFVHDVPDWMLRVPAPKPEDASVKHSKLRKNTTLEDMLVFHWVIRRLQMARKLEQEGKVRSNSNRIILVGGYGVPTNPNEGWIISELGFIGQPVQTEIPEQSNDSEEIDFFDMEPPAIDDAQLKDMIAAYEDYDPVFYDSPNRYSVDYLDTQRDRENRTNLLERVSMAVKDALDYYQLCEYITGYDMYIGKDVDKKQPWKFVVKPGIGDPEKLMPPDSLS